jgi:hypothetical protein
MVMFIGSVNRTIPESSVLGFLSVNPAPARQPELKPFLQLVRPSRHAIEPMTKWAGCLAAGPYAPFPISAGAMKLPAHLGRLGCGNRAACCRWPN